MNGLPHRDVRSTITAPADLRQPATRRRRTRTGVISNRPLQRRDHRRAEATAGFRRHGSVETNRRGGLRGCDGGGECSSGRPPLPVAHTLGVLGHPTDRLGHPLGHPGHLLAHLLGQLGPPSRWITGCPGKIHARCTVDRARSQCCASSPTVGWRSPGSSRPRRIASRSPSARSRYS